MPEKEKCEKYNTLAGPRQINKDDVAGRSIAPTSQQTTQKAEFIKEEMNAKLYLLLNALGSGVQTADIEL